MLDWRCALERLTPRKLRPLGRFCYAWFARHGIEREIKRYYQRVPPNDEMKEALAFLTKGTLPTFPYAWAYARRAEDVCVSFDEEKKLPYVLVERKRLYFPASWDHDRIRSCFHAVENVDQNPQSPHRYLTENFTVGAGDIVVDGGAAEGNFGLRVVERVKKVYIFEPESYWQEPLQATFAPWKDKVVIVQKYLSEQDSETAVALDAYFADKDKPTFIKLDVEGFEADVLEGASDLLATSVKRAVLCTYHYAGDEAKLTDMMRARHFSVTPSRGYMLFQLYDKLKPPYFRRALIRCEKNA